LNDLVYLGLFVAVPSPCFLIMRTPPSTPPLADAPTFALGVRWHGECDPQKKPINCKLFEAFGGGAESRRRA